MNQYIVDQCKKEYPKCETIFDKFYYKIDKLGDIEKISFWFDQEFNCPMYCLCDGNYMMWYGDHGSFTFDCTWKTSLFKIPFNSPHYLFEKLDMISIDGSAGRYFDSYKCKEEVLNYLYKSGWWEDLSDYNKSKIKAYLTSDKWFPDIADYKISNNVDKCLVEEIRELIGSTSDRYDFISKIRELDRADSPFECCELYSAGEQISYHFWFILMCLNWIYDQELQKQEILNE